MRSPRQARLRDLASIAAATTLVVSAIAALVFLGLSMVGFVNPPANVGGLPAGAFAIPIVILTALAEPDSLEARSDELRA